MSRYNHIKSIPVDSIPKRKIKRAIHEWAEGDKSLERLLTVCYEKEIKTSGCHAGAGPFIDFKDHENIKKIEVLFETVQKFENSQIAIMVDGGNPYSGPEWFIPTLGFGCFTKYKDEADIFFDTLTEEIEKEKEYNNHPIMDLFRFFKNKETDIFLRFRHTKEDKYIFTIELPKTTDERLNYFKNIFKKAGLIEIPFDIEKCPHHEWKLENDNLDNINNKIKEVYEYIKNNYNLDIPTEDEIYNFKALVRYRMKKYNKPVFKDKELDKILKEIQDKNNKEK